MLFDEKRRQVGLNSRRQIKATALHRITTYVYICLPVEEALLPHLCLPAMYTGAVIQKCASRIVKNYVMQSEASGRYVKLWRVSEISFKIATINASFAGNQSSMSESMLPIEPISKSSSRLSRRPQPNRPSSLSSSEESSASSSPAAYPLRPAR